MMIHDPIDPAGNGPTIAAPGVTRVREPAPGQAGMRELAALLGAGRTAGSRRGFMDEAMSSGGDDALRRACAAGRTPFGACLEAEVRSTDRILVFGDYDADGVCSTASMVMALTAARRVIGGRGLGSGDHARDAAGEGV